MFYFLQSNTRYFVNHLERFTCHYSYIHIYNIFNNVDSKKKTKKPTFINELLKYIYIYKHIGLVVRISILDTEVDGSNTSISMFSP